MLSTNWHCILQQGVSQFSGGFPLQGVNSYENSSVYSFKITKDSHLKKAVAATVIRSLLYLLLEWRLHVNGITNDSTLLTAATKTVMVKEIQDYELQLQKTLFTLLVVFSHRMRQEHIWLTGIPHISDPSWTTWGMESWSSTRTSLRRVRWSGHAALKNFLMEQ